MTDLHSTLRAAVEHRLDLARKAFDPAGWDPPEYEYDQYGPDRADNETRAFIAANSPDVIIRQCEADLRRLERHRPNAIESEAAGLCAYGWHEPWPCADVRDIAAAYGVAQGHTPCH